MVFSEIIRSRRTIRRFHNRPIDNDILLNLIDLAHWSSNAGNRQRLRYIVIKDSELIRKILPLTAWAGLVKPKRTPQYGVDAPTAFIALTAPEDGSHIEADAGAAIQVLELAAWEKGIGCCWIGAFDHNGIDNLLGCHVIYLVALGYPAEFPKSEEITGSGSIAYYLDDQDVLHVPRIRAQELITWL